MMKIRSYYFKWFDIFTKYLIDIFFVIASIATLFVFTSVFSGPVKYVIFALITAIYLLIIYYFKDRIYQIIKTILDKIDLLDVKKMLIIISAVMVILKIIGYIFWNFDATQGADIKIYNDIANSMIESGKLKSDDISHLFGTAIHFVVIRKLGMPLTLGMFIFFYLGTIINFFSFKDILDKNQSFAIVMTYILMPSTVLFTFCPTHEIFVYLYLSAFIYLLNRLLKTESNKEIIICSLLMILDIALLCMVNPAGNIAYIILLLIILLTNVKLNKKIILLAVILLAYSVGYLKDSYLEVNQYRTTINTYTILIHGSNPESLGEQVDGYPLKQMRNYIVEHNMGYENEDFVYAAKQVLINQYLYLLKHPITLIRLLAHKIYILWSGDHYPIELAYNYHSINNLTYYLMLIVSTIMYLFVLTIQTVYKQKERKNLIAVTNYRLAVLGVIAITLLSIVLNKYDIYITLYVYFLAFESCNFVRQKENNKIDLEEL